MWVHVVTTNGINDRSRCLPRLQMRSLQAHPTILGPGLVEGGPSSGILVNQAVSRMRAPRSEGVAVLCSELPAYLFNEQTIHSCTSQTRFRSGGQKIISLEGADPHARVRQHNRVGGSSTGRPNQGQERTEREALWRRSHKIWLLQTERLPSWWAVSI